MGSLLPADSGGSSGFRARKESDCRREVSRGRGPTRGTVPRSVGVGADLLSPDPPMFRLVRSYDASDGSRDAASCTKRLCKPSANTSASSIVAGNTSGSAVARAARRPSAALGTGEAASLLWPVEHCTCVASASNRGRGDTTVSGHTDEDRHRPVQSRLTSVLIVRNADTVAADVVRR